MSLCLCSAATDAYARVLPGGLEPAIEALFGRLAPSLRLERGEIGQQAVRATLCDSSNVCGTIVLSDPEPRCDGARHGPWCVSGLEGLSSGAAAVSAVLDADTGSYWRTIESAPRPERLSPPPPPPTPPPSLLLALLIVAVITVVGWSIGRWARDSKRGANRRGTRAIAACLAIFVVFAASELLWAWIDLWDGLLYALLLIAAIAIGSLQVSRMAWAVAAIASVVGLAGAEITVWAVATSPPPLPNLPFGVWHRPDPWASGAVHRTWLWEQYACDALFGGGQPLSTGSGPTTLHLGDSMIHGIHVPEAETVVALVGASYPNQHHVGIGLPGTTVDAALLLLRKHTAALSPVRVVYYVYPANDLEELDAPLPCCSGAALLNRADPNLGLACTDPDARVLGLDSLTMLWQLSPAPYLLRAAARHSQLAARSVGVVAAPRRTTGAGACVPFGRQGTLARIRRDVGAVCDRGAGDRRAGRHRDHARAHRHACRPRSRRRRRTRCGLPPPPARACPSPSRAGARRLGPFRESRAGRPCRVVQQRGGTRHPPQPTRPRCGGEMAHAATEAGTQRRRWRANPFASDAARRVIERMKNGRRSRVALALPTAFGMPRLRPRSGHKPGPPVCCAHAGPKESCPSG